MAEQFSVSYLLKLIDNISSPLAKVGNAFDEIDKKFNAAGKSAAGMGRSMTAFATLPIMGWATYASHEAGKVNVAFREMGQALEDLPADKLVALKTDLSAMSTVVPRSVEDLAGYAKMAGKMNELGDVLGFTKFMSQFTIANEDMVGNTESFMDMARAIGLTQSEYEHMGDVITLLSKRFNTSASTMIQNALDLGGSLNAPKDQLMVLSAYMDTFGAASMPIKRLVEEMNQAAIGKNMLNLEIMAKTAGFGTDLSGFQKEFAESPATVLQKLLKGFGQLKGEDLYTLRKIFDQIGIGGMRTIGVVNKAVQSLPELSRMLELVADKQKVTGAMSKEADDKLGDFGNQMKMLMGTLDLFASQFGKDIKPVFALLVSMAKEMLATFTKLPAVIRYAIEGLLGFAAIVGPLLIGFAVLKGGLAVAGLGKGLASLVPIATALSTALLPVLAVIAAMGAGAAVGTGISKGLDWATEKLGGGSEGLGGAIYDWTHATSGAGNMMSSKGEATIRVELGNGLRTGDVKTKGNLFPEAMSEGYAGMKFAH